MKSEGSGSLTKEQHDSLTPGQVIDELKKGNQRFRVGKMVLRDYSAAKHHRRGFQTQRKLRREIRSCLNASVQNPYTAMQPLTFTAEVS